MEITELKAGQRVRVPSDKEGKNHYAYVTDIISGLYGEELVIIRIPALAVEKNRRSQAPHSDEDEAAVAEKEVVYETPW